MNLMCDESHVSSTRMLLEDQTDHTPSALMQRKRACHACSVLEGHPEAVAKNVF